MKIKPFSGDVVSGRKRNFLISPQLLSASIVSKFSHWWVWLWMDLKTHEKFFCFWNLFHWIAFNPSNHITNDDPGFIPFVAALQAEHVTIVRSRLVERKKSLNERVPPSPQFNKRLQFNPSIISHLFVVQSLMEMSCLQCCRGWLLDYIITTF